MRGALANPYVGLRPFEEKDARYFFGRDGQVDPMVDLLAANRFLGVVGVSGSGKSSLVRAGLLPALHAGGLPTGQREWVVVDMKPRSQPIRNLAEALARSAVLEGAPEELGSREDYAEAALRHSSAGLAALAGQPLTGERANAYSLLVLVDQFEEIFRFARLGSADEADQFIQLLLSAADQRLVPVYVVLTMRSDFLGDCARFRGLPEHLNRSQYIIPRLERKDLRAAIEGPARLAGMEVDPALVTRLLNDLGEEPNRLPLLQHALRRLWDRWEKDGKTCQHEGCEGNEDGRAQGNGNLHALPLHLYLDKVGTLDGDASATEVLRQQGALHRHVQEVYDHLPDDAAREKVKTLFKTLTELAPDNRPIRRPEKAALLAGLLWPDLAAEEALKKLGALTQEFREEQAGFLTPAIPPVELEKDTSLDISHESLISHWATLKEWVRQEADDARQLRRLLDDAERGLKYDDAQLGKVAAWWERRLPGPAWAERYVPGQWEKVAAFYAQERKSAERRAVDRKDAEDRASRDAARGRYAVIGVVVLLAGAFAISFWYYWGAAKAAERAQAATRIAVRTRSEAQAALVKSFVRTIGRGDADVGPSEVEWDALWELAGLEADNEEVRTKVINSWSQAGGDPGLAQANGWAGLKAATGLVPERLSLRQMAEGAVASLASVPVEDEAEVFRMGQAGRELAERLDENTATELAGRVLSEMRVHPPEESGRLFSLGDVLGGLVSRTDEKTAGELASKGAGKLIRSLSSSANIEVYQSGYRMDVTRRLCRFLPPLEAEVYVEQALEVMRSAPDPEHASISAFASILESLAPRVEGPAAVARLEAAADLLSKSVVAVIPLGRGKLGERLEVIGALAGRLREPAVKEVAGRLLQMLDHPANKDGEVTTRLTLALDAYAARLEAEEGEEVTRRSVDRLMAILEREEVVFSYTLTSVERALKKLMARATPTVAEDAAGRIVRMLEMPDKVQSPKLKVLANILCQAAARLEKASLEQKLQRLVSIVESREETRVDRLTRLSRAAVSLAELDRNVARSAGLQRVTHRLVETMNKTQTIEITDMVGLAEAINHLAEFDKDLAPDETLEQVCRRLLALMNAGGSEIGVWQMSQLGIALATVAGNVDASKSLKLKEEAAKLLLRDMNPLPSEGGLPPAGYGRALLANLSGLQQEMAEVLAISAWKRLMGRSDPDSREILAGFARYLPDTLRQYRVLALEAAFTAPIPSFSSDSSDPSDGMPEPDVRRDVRLLCDQLDNETLVDLLKWPSCRGEAERLVLSELDERYKMNSNGDLWKFVEMARGLGFSGLNLPPMRPTSQLLGASSTKAFEGLVPGGAH